MTNRLSEAASPYLLQHKDNPVDWFQWGEDAFAKARAEDKPILLSVGYAACHWCHVMAHESFENEEIAALMNRLFVNIKVDREERPDLDAIYQNALALLGEHGGWPLTMFLTPRGEPFWGGTYFPPEPRFGRPGFPQVLEGLAAAYRDKREDVNKNVGALTDALTKLAQPQAGGVPSLQLLDQIGERIAREVDPVNGGIGSAPKFPQPSIMKLILSTWRRGGNAALRDAFHLTMTRMSQGGIYDHLGGGYARYAVDAHWLVPHFEKMLYDNAQILELLTLAWQDRRDPLYAQRARETVSWLLREMIAEDAGGGPSGAFAATLDADSEGEEGKFYVWSEAEVDAALGADAALFKEVYDVRPEGNWEGKTILNRLGDTALRGAQEEEQLKACREILLRLRDGRVRPGWDDKVLADWNGLMIDALAKAGAAFGEPSWLEAAQGAFAAVCERLGKADGGLLHSWRRGTPGPEGMLEDYAAMIGAAISLSEAGGDETYLAAAGDWCAVLERDFADAGGGFFQTAAGGENLVVRNKNANDNATPSGNGIMAINFARLFLLTGEARWRERAQAQIEAFAGELERNFFPLTSILSAAAFLQDGVQAVVIGRRGEEETELLLAALESQCLPERTLRLLAPEEALPEGHPAHGKTQVRDKATAYICRGTTCSLPATTPEELIEAL